MNMRKSFIWTLLGVAMSTLVLSGCGSSSISSSEDTGFDWEFEVGTDVVEAEAIDATEWSSTFTVNLKVVGGSETVLYNGTVQLKSNTMWASEFLKAAVTDKALAQEGIDVGFVTTLGDYVNNAEDGIYWMYTVNGVSPSWGCNQYQMRDGDYMLWTYEVVDWDATPVEPGRPTGDWAFEVGTDEVVAEAIDATEWSPAFTINLKIVGGSDDVLFNGTVELTSNTMWASEFLKAAVTDKALAQEGIDVGFVTTIGDYVNNAEDSIYWMFTVSGITPSWGCNQFQMRQGDYMLWTYDVVVW